MLLKIVAFETRLASLQLSFGANCEMFLEIDNLIISRYHMGCMIWF